MPDILEVLRNGHHEKTKDSWNEQFKAWDYAIKGKTIDQEICIRIPSLAKYLKQSQDYSYVPISINAKDELISAA